MFSSRFFFACVTLVLALFSRAGIGQELSPYSYDIGSPNVRSYFVDPVNGSDSADGSTAAKAFRTVQFAWNKIPQSSALNVGYEINLMNGNYGYDELPNYWELRRGTFENPIILKAAAGQSAVKFVRDINMANVSFFYLLNINITPNGGGDTFHCEQCDHILLRGNVLNGGSTTTGAHETVKVNQSQYIYIENNDISFADDNNIDFVAVQYGHVIGNKIHDALDWCEYAKGGSAYIRIEGNEFYNCGTGGFTAGQGSGFQFIMSPWLHYEAYDIKFVNNVVHDTEGAAFGVNGGYNILIGNNTAYRTGSRDHLVEVVFGERTCDGQRDGDRDANCSSNNAAGGWGASRVRTTPDPIGNRNVQIVNNIIYNPAGFRSAQHFAIYGPRTSSADSNIPSPQRSDVNLVIRGNVIWNGDSTTPLGVEDGEQGCQPGNATCNAAQILRDNSVNAIEPRLADPANHDFRPLTGGALLSLQGVAVDAFAGGDRVQPPLAPEGILSNRLSRDLSGAATTESRPPGAYLSDSVSLSPPSIGGSTTPTGPGSGPGGGAGSSTPAVSRIAVTQKRTGKRAKFTVRATVANTPTSVTAVVKRKAKAFATIVLKASAEGQYVGSGNVTAVSGVKVSVAVTATNSAGSGSRSKSVVLK